MYLQKSQALNLSFENQIVVQDQQAPQETLTLFNIYSCTYLIQNIWNNAGSDNQNLRF